MKKNLAIILAIVLITLSLTSCLTKKDNNNVTSKPAATTSKIALVCSAAGVNDNGYNQSAVKGLEKLKKEFTNIETKVVETTTDYPGVLKTLAEAGYNMIFSLEYNFDALITGVGGQKPLAEQYPNITWVIFNANPNLKEDGSIIHKNVIPILFDVHQSSFLAGALSALVNENNQILFDAAKYNFTQGDKGRKVGFIGGTQSSGIEVFSYGYAEGINYIAKELNVNYTYLSTYDAGFADSAKGATTAASYYSAGANVVNGVAGAVGDGIDSKAKELKKLSIQVDANKDAQQSGYILTSVLKNTEVPVYELGKKMLDGSISKDGKEIDYSLKSGATSITDLSEISKYIKTDAAAQAKWTEIKNKIEDLKTKISDGTIKVTNAQAGEKLDINSLSNLKTVS